ncbi:MgtC/SapB family protein [Proteiniclasticum sp. SCR006]|jgi:putative Mg2+ transporter-C (MgtC) family protein|uniref:MgtC/SapB family protein n=1 Tax=Proteiniclasticum aestuarii TaxID=2817862 RepID=A0A939HDQ1_9CLOT|nr:MgtC/SapB family protein [Proteiniclasticum aestuarii]MBO1265670.1 MgtC/SapB family protein [Proteiniclasticum aestuarii]
MAYEEILLRLAIAVFTGGAIGYEREYKNRPAGFRTHILVCIGAAVISLIQVNMNEEIIRRVLINPNLKDILRADYGRLSAQVISGIGFLGAGTIIHNKGSIKGLTTAATLWLVATLGLAIGYGYYVISLAALVICVIVLISLKRIQNKLFHGDSNMKIDVDFAKRSKAVDYINEYFEKQNIHVVDIHFMTNAVDGVKSCIYTINLPRSLNILQVIRDLAHNDNILEIREHVDEQ